MLILQVYKQNVELKAEVTQLKSSEKLKELEQLKEKYDSLSQDFDNSEKIMDQLEETKSNFENLPLLKNYKVCCYS